MSRATQLELKRLDRKLLVNKLSGAVALMALRTEESFGRSLMPRLSEEQRERAWRARCRQYKAMERLLAALERVAVDR